MHKVYIFTVTIVLAVGFNLSAQPPAGTESKGFDELTKEKGVFKKTLTNPEVEFSKYEAICPFDVQLDFRVAPAAAAGETTGTLTRNKSKGVAPPDREVRARYKDVIASSLVQELTQRDVLRVVDQPGPGTLILRPAVVDMISKIPSASGSPDELRGKLIGEGTIVFDLIDAETGQVVAHCSERRRIKKGEASSGDSESATLWDDVGSWAQEAAADLCQELARLQG